MTHLWRPQHLQNPLPSTPTQALQGLIAVHAIHWHLHVHACCLFELQTAASRSSPCFYGSCLNLTLMYCYDDWLLLSCCTVQPLVCSHGQVNDIQDSQPAHLRSSKCQVAVTTHVRQHLNVWSSLNINCIPDSHSRLLGVQLIYRRCGTCYLTLLSQT